jgi:hypothetical protein
MYRIQYIHRNVPNALNADIVLMSFYFANDLPSSYACFACASIRYPISVKFILRLLLLDSNPRRLVLNPVNASTFVTVIVALCASGVFADFVNSGVWLPPFGTVGIAEGSALGSLYAAGIRRRTICWMDSWELCRYVSV